MNGTSPGMSLARLPISMYDDLHDWVRFLSASGRDLAFLLPTGRVADAVAFSIISVERIWYRH